MEASGDAVPPQCPILHNCPTYRKHTNRKFERVFKSTLKKEKLNLIDNATHVRWMELAGFTFNDDVNMFKQFSRKKALALEEYKSLIEKMCTYYKLDYWDVLSKMATFQNEGSNKPGTFRITSE